MTEEKRYRVNASVPASALERLRKAYDAECEEARRKNRLPSSQGGAAGTMIVKGLQVHEFQQRESFQKVYAKECEKAIRQGRAKSAECEVLHSILMKGLTALLAEE